MATGCALLGVAAHQIEYSHHAPEATVHAAVDAVRLLGAARASALVNAVLRRFVAGRAALLAVIDRDLAARTAHPAWLVERLAAAWQERCPDLLAANNVHPPMTLRVDLSRWTVEECIAALAASSIGSETVQWMPSALILTRPVTVGALPGFSRGLVSVQDAGAQLAAHLLDPRPGMRVLDGCAAPGGKTGHLLEYMGPGADLTALDIDPERLGRVGENLLRLGRGARLLAADMRDPAWLRDGQPFDRILVDAPCSATGVIRRHPDIKLLRRASDIPALAEEQLAILRAAVGLLSPGGRLLYSTCSVLPEENEAVIARLLASCPEVTVLPAPVASRSPAALSSPLAGPTPPRPAASCPPGALPRQFGLQLLPGAAAGTDGFYYACLEKTTVAI